MFRRGLEAVAVVTRRINSAGCRTLRLNRSARRTFAISPRSFSTSRSTEEHTDFEEEMEKIFGEPLNQSAMDRGDTKPRIRQEEAYQVDHEPHQQVDLNRVDRVSLSSESEAPPAAEDMSAFFARAEAEAANVMAHSRTANPTNQTEEAKRVRVHRKQIPDDILEVSIVRELAGLRAATERVALALERIVSEREK